MAQINDLKDLLKHEILDLYSAEEQIIEALPKMIENAKNPDLKKALTDHLKVTELQKKRLDDVKELLSDDNDGEIKERKGFFSKLFGGSGGEKCKGTEGLITEGEKMMGEDMTPEVMDAAILASAQKVEHYEICGYGTAAAYARELGLTNVADLLTQTLNEEYFADDSLTKLAVGRLNIEAENPVEEKAGSSKNPDKSRMPASKSSKISGAKKSAPKKSAPAKSSVRKRAPVNSAAKKSPLKKSSLKKSPVKKSPVKKSPIKVSKSSGNKSAVKPGSKTGKSTSKTSSKGKSVAFKNNARKR